MWENHWKFCGTLLQHHGKTNMLLAFNIVEPWIILLPYIFRTACPISVIQHFAMIYCKINLHQSRLLQVRWVFDYLTLRTTSRLQIHPVMWRRPQSSSKWTLWSHQWDVFTAELQWEWSLCVNVTSLSTEIGLLLQTQILTNFTHLSIGENNTWEQHLEQLRNQSNFAADIEYKTTSQPTCDHEHEGCWDICLGNT